MQICRIPIVLQLFLAQNFNFRKMYFVIIIFKSTVRASFLCKTVLRRLPRQPFISQVQIPCRRAFAILACMSPNWSRRKMLDKSCQVTERAHVGTISVLLLLSLSLSFATSLFSTAIIFCLRAGDKWTIGSATINNKYKIRHLSNTTWQLIKKKSSTNNGTVERIIMKRNVCELSQIPPLQLLMVPRNKGWGNCPYMTLNFFLERINCKPPIENGHN